MFSFPLLPPKGFEKGVQDLKIKVNPKTMTPANYMKTASTVFYLFHFYSLEATISSTNPLKPSSGDARADIHFSTSFLFIFFIFAFVPNFKFLATPSYFCVYFFYFIRNMEAQPTIRSLKVPKRVFSNLQCNLSMLNWESLLFSAYSKKALSTPTLPLPKGGNWSTFFWNVYDWKVFCTKKFK